MVSNSKSFGGKELGPEHIIVDTINKITSVMTSACHNLRYPESAGLGPPEVIKGFDVAIKILEAQKNALIKCMSEEDDG